MDWPDWAPRPVLDALAKSGVDAPWAHQREAAELAHAGRHVLIATGTASGKSLAYQLPALTALAGDDHTRVLYLSPTKALAGDQLRALAGLDLPFLRPATFDGDTPTDQRDWVRAHANWVLTNPDMVSLRDPARAPALGELPAPPALRRDRRVPPLPRRVRFARRFGPAPVAPGVRALRGRAHIRAGVGHGVQCR